MIDSTATRTVLVEGVKADDLVSRLRAAAEEMPAMDFSHNMGFAPYIPLDFPEQHFRRIKARICVNYIPKYWSDAIVEKLYLDSGRMIYPRTIRTCNEWDREIGMRGDLGFGGGASLEILEPLDEDDFIVIHFESREMGEINYKEAPGYQTVAAAVGSIVPYDLEPGFSPLDFDALIEQLGGRMYCLDDCFENAIGKKATDSAIFGEERTDTLKQIKDHHKDLCTGLYPFECPRCERIRAEKKSKAIEHIKAIQEKAKPFLKERILQLIQNDNIHSFTDLFTDKDAIRFDAYFDEPHEYANSPEYGRDRDEDEKSSFFELLRQDDALRNVCGDSPQAFLCLHPLAVDIWQETKQERAALYWESHPGEHATIEKRISKVTNEIRALDRQIEEAQAELSSLNLFGFMRKKKLREVEQESLGLKTECESKLKDLQSRFEEYPFD